MKKEVVDVIVSKSHFPCKIELVEGIILKKFFTVDEKFNEERRGKIQVQELEYRYTFISEENIKYYLLEEYLFKENETIFTVENSVGVNYYLDRRNLNT